MPTLSDGEAENVSGSLDLSQIDSTVTPDLYALVSALDMTGLPSTDPTDSHTAWGPLPSGWTPYTQEGAQPGWYMQNSQTGEIQLTPQSQAKVNKTKINWTGVIADLAVIAGGAISAAGEVSILKIIAGVMASGGEASRSTQEKAVN